MIFPVPRVLCFGFAALAVLMTAACGGSGVADPDDEPPAMEALLHFAAPIPAGAKSVGVELRAIPFCPTGDVQRHDYPQFNLRQRRLIRPSVTPETELLTAPLYGSTDPRTFCADNAPFAFPLVRFFTVTAWFTDVPPTERWQVWQARNTVVAYAEEDVDVQPYGHSPDTLRLPAGYSVLHRACGTADVPWTLEVVAPHAPIDLAPFNELLDVTAPASVRAVLEQWETSLLGDCAIPPPSPSFGTRVSFDRATSVALSEDGNELVYLAGIDASDPASLAPLRSLRLDNLAQTQLGAVAGGSRVQMTRGSDLVVSARADAIYIDRPSGNEGPADGLVTQRTIAGARQGILSPDGRWLAAYAQVNDAFGVRIWNLASGTMVDCGDSTIAGWSASSRLLVGSPSASATPDALLDPSSCAVEEQFDGGHNAWGETGPVWASSFELWQPELSLLHPQQFATNRWRGFAVSPTFATSPAESGVAAPPILTAADGVVIPALTVPGAAFVWSQKCLGLFETVCTYTLHRIGLPGADDLVLGTADAPAPIAVSLSGHRVAIATRDGLFVKDISLETR
jgi:hypothetical protein